MTHKKYELTPDHRAQLRPWHERWVNIAMRTAPQTDDDRAAMRDAVNGLYRSAGLAEPKHIVFVPSPLVGQVASGFAAAIWHMREHSLATQQATGLATERAIRQATWQATEQATERAIRQATELATRQVTELATRQVTEQATGQATWQATWQVTEQATGQATWQATELATRQATWQVTQQATEGWAWRLAKAIAPAAADFLISCAQAAISMYAGGNMWVAGVDFISFFRHVAKLKLDYSKWQHYEAAAIYGGWRFMHPQFCMVVDFPELLLVDQARRPHCADGPSHRWRDGFEIYHWHGLRLPIGKEWIIADKARITPELIDAEENAELRRVMLEVYGFDRYLAARSHKVLASDELHGQPRRLIEIAAPTPIRVIEVVNGSLEPDGTRRRFHLGAMPGVTPHEVVAASYGLRPDIYREAVRT